MLESTSRRRDSWQQAIGSGIEYAGQQNSGPPNGLFQYVGFLGMGAIGLQNVTDGVSKPTWLNNCAARIATTADRGTHTSTIGENWWSGLYGYTMGDVILPPNPLTPDCSYASGSGSLANPGVIPPRSDHPGGANVLMADGSVRFLKTSVSQVTICSLGSIACGEVITSDSY